MVEGTRESLLTIIRSSSQLDFLRVNDGWGDFLSRGSGSEASIGKISGFYSFLSFHFPRSGRVERVVLGERGTVFLEGRDDVFGLSVEELEDQFSRFDFLKLIDPWWPRHPEVASVFASPQALSSERIHELDVVARDFRPEIPLEGEENTLPWTTVLLMKGLVQSSCSHNDEKKIKVGLLTELFRGDIFMLTRGEEGVVLRAVLGERREEWWIQPRLNGSFEVFPPDLSRKDRIGRCCFSVKIFSLGLNMERSLRIEAHKGSESPEEMMERTSKVTIARIIYDQYPASDYCICMRINEVDVGKETPRVEVFAKTDLKAHLKIKERGSIGQR